MSLDAEYLHDFVGTGFTNTRQSNSRGQTKKEFWHAPTPTPIPSPNIFHASQQEEEEEEKEDEEEEKEEEEKEEEKEDGVSFAMQVDMDDMVLPEI